MTLGMAFAFGFSERLFDGIISSLEDKVDQQRQAATKPQQPASTIQPAAVGASKTPDHPRQMSHSERSRGAGRHPRMASCPAFGRWLLLCHAPLAQAAGNESSESASMIVSSMASVSVRRRRSSPSIVHSSRHGVRRRQGSLRQDRPRKRIPSAEGWLTRPQNRVHFALGRASHPYRRWRACVPARRGLHRSKAVSL
jgi:hypothetical protein